MRNKSFIFSLIFGIIMIILGVNGFVYASSSFGSEIASITDVGAVKGNTVTLKEYKLASGVEGETIEKAMNDVITNSTTGSSMESKISGKGGIIDKYAAAFCVKHGKGLSKAGGPYLSRAHTGSINVNKYIKFTKDDSTPTITADESSTFKDYCEAGSTDGNRNTASNFHGYIYWSGKLKDIKSASQNVYGVENPSNNAIAYAISFSDKTSSTHYENTESQKAIWNVTGAQPSSTTNLYKAGKAVDELETQIAAHGRTLNVTVNDSEHPGTVYLEDTQTYRVGPFHMSDYAYVYSDYVKDYSGKDLSQFKGLVGGIDSGKIILKDDDGNETVLDFFGDSGVKIVFKDFYGNDTSKGDYTRYNASTYTKAVPEDEVIYPFPNSTFYIDIPRSSSNNATTLDSIVFNYRETTTDGEGSVVVCRYAKTTWNQIDKGTNGCTRYYCPGGGGHSHDSASTGGSHSCNYCYWCETYTETCSNPEHGSHTYTRHHYTDHTTIFRCRHGHIDCNNAYWHGNSSVGYGQPILACTSASVTVTDTPYTNTMNIRLTTKIIIKKYVKSIKHATNEEYTFGASATSGSNLTSSETPEIRKAKTDSQKQSDPVYAEYGDIITYSIDLINEQNYEVKVKLKDILPSNVEVQSRTFEDWTWITVPKEGKHLELVVMTVANDDTLYVNEVKLVTKNNSLKKDEDENVDFVRTTDSRVGPVVNLTEIDTPEDIVSKEYHKINDYNLDIDKYITEYNHEMMTENNNNTLTNEAYKLESRINKTIADKKNYPVPVEKTETLTYSIRLTNNSVKTGNNKVATKIRPSEIIDVLDKGLEYKNIKATIYDGSGNVKFTLSNGDFSLTEESTGSNKFYIRVSDKKGSDYLIIEPQGYIIFEMEVEVVESNMYLNLMENKVNISILTNINNGASTSDVCPTCQGKKKIKDVVKCNSCSGTGMISEYEKCSVCNGTGDLETGTKICSECNGTGLIQEDCNHEGTSRTYVCKKCGAEFGVLEGEAGPTVCNTYLGERQCNSTSFTKMCTADNDPANKCEHYKYYCSGTTEKPHTKKETDNINDCGYSYSCAEYNKTPSFTYTYTCKKCNTSYTSSSSNYDTTNKCSKLFLNSKTGLNETCNGDLEIKSSKCNYCGETYTSRKVTTCEKQNYISCTNTSFEEYCTYEEVEQLSSSCNHYKYVCTNCDKEYTTKPAQCTEEISDGYCDSTEFDVDCLNCENGKIYKTCTTCSGTGEHETDTVTCTNCNGSGKAKVYKSCTSCLGTGNVSVNVSCPGCGGTGKRIDVSSGDRIVRKADGSINRNLAKNEDDDGDGSNEQSSEYVRMKDLVISGKVWLDKNRDGQMNENTITDSDKEYYNVNDSGMKKDVVVRLYKEDGTLVRTTKTDSNGLFTFSRNESLSWYDDYKSSCFENYNSSTMSQRIDKATGKDKYGNYTSSSKYINYYIEYEYDGVLYKSTEFYAGMSNITDTTTGKFDIKYYTDSNATEFKDVRENFNKEYEYISYNVAYNTNMEKTNFQDIVNTAGLTEAFGTTNSDKNESNLTFDKTEHTSQLMENNERLITARAFIKNTDSNKGTDNGISNTNLLWFFKNNEPGYSYNPETEYLKYINLGLELREDVDISTTKDVYKVKTTINGEEMEYNYNQNNGINGKVSGGNKYLQDYIIKEPYGLDIYESDYKYRFEQYTSQAVREYKGEESELNIEVTYRITVNNNAVTDDDTVKRSEGEDKPNVTDTKLDVRVNEILDLYDENFIKFTEDVTKDVITIKEKDADGFLQDKTIKIAEAWYYKKISDVDSQVLSLLQKENSSITSVDNIPASMRYTISGDVSANEKPIYVQSDDGEYVQVPLMLSNTSSRYTKDENGNFISTYTRVGEFSDTKDNNFTADGYNTLYITGMGNEVIHEGSEFDIYVKYVVDKSELQVTNTNERYLETKSVETRTNTPFGEVISGETTYQSTFTLSRSIKLAERTSTSFKTNNGRGTENIAQVNAYSVWYTDGKPASLVDMDSNAGNIGIKTNTEKTSIDDIDYYEDTVYKTGIEITSDASENTKEEVNKKYGSAIIKVDTSANYKVIRKINGTVWDDSRSEILGDNDKEIQYIGNGIRSDSDTKQENAKINDIIPIKYKNGIGITEEKDIAVRSAKVEFIEIVQIDPTHYYEQTLTDVTWEQVQNIRTDTNGEYELSGFVPGRYIVRFTYGDTINDEIADVTDSSLSKEDVQDDMRIFNGQDYKSTLYNSVPDTETDMDKIILGLEAKNISDARDDEIRRLEVNSYSEVMTNEVAEILKGLANSTNLTENSEANSETLLDELTNNTYMQAETVEFLVKAEKLTTDQTKDYVAKQIIKLDYNPTIQEMEEIYYRELENIKFKDTNERAFTISNVDFGIEYRPENEVELTKEVDEIKISTSSKDNDGEGDGVLVDLYFYTTGDETGGEKVKHHLDEERSVGFELIQFVSNTYNSSQLVSKLTTEDTQGFIYIQVDDEVLQGSEVEIVYKFKAENRSEVDRISKNLDLIRYKNNKETQSLIEKYTSDVIGENNQNYTASRTARNVVYKDMYASDSKDGTVYRNSKKTLTTDGDNGYFGRYVGYGYYTGQNNKTLDTISSIKFDKILDYVDTDLQYNQQKDVSKISNKYWYNTTTSELINYVYALRGYRQDGAVAGSSIVSDSIKKLIDITGIEYDSLVISVDDRTVDDSEKEDGKTYNDVINEDISRFLIPRSTDDGKTKDGVTRAENGKTEDDKDLNDYYYKSTGIIYLPVYKVFSAETKTDDMTFENIAEVIQYTTLTGRRTNFATTIGNANINSENNNPNTLREPESPAVGSKEFKIASLEPDTSATETITLTPPTGLMRNRRAIVNVIDTAKTGTSIVLIVVAVVGIVIFVTRFAIRKYKKRRIK
jgi:uncharacterized repeat protein (TIGR01451 family)